MADYPALVTGGAGYITGYSMAFFTNPKNAA